MLNERDVQNTVDPKKGTKAEDKPITTSNEKPSSPDQSEKPENFKWGDGIEIEVSSSKMSATISLDLLHSEYYKAEDIARYLRVQKFKDSIDKEAIEKIFEKHLFNQSIKAVKGTPPENGKDGYVNWNINLSILEGAELVERGGQVNWKDSHHVLHVQADQLLARLIPPTNGINGKDIYGEPLYPKPGKPAKFPAGKGMRISEDGQELYAEISGAISRDGERYSVNPIYTVEGNVDLKTGNIKYDETVVVTGDVLSDFIVHAGQDIHVNGLVEGAELITDGNIYINGGVQGEEKAVIKAAGEIVVKFLNNAAEVEAGGDITVKGPITNSIVKSKGSIKVEGNKSVILGGHVSSEREISADVLGSEIGVSTLLELGADLGLIADRYKEEEKKVESLKANHEKLQKTTAVLNALRDKGKIKPEQEETRLKIVRASMQLQGQLKKGLAEIKVFHEQIEVARKMQKGITARKEAWPGVTIQIMKQPMHIKAHTSKAVFALMKGEIETFAYAQEEESKEKKKSDS